MGSSKRMRHIAVSLRIGSVRRRGRRLCAGFILACLLQWPVIALAGPNSWFFGSKPQIPHPSVVRIIVDESDGVSLGSGTLVDVRGSYGLVVTNWHVVRDAEGPIRVKFPDGFKSAARVLKVDRDWDLAALIIWKPGAQPIPLASAAPRLGETLTIAGYGSGDYRAVSGVCTQYVAPSHRHPYEMVEVSAAARQGDSGGPIFNSRGELAGVLFGSGGGTTSGSYAGRVGSFLATSWPPPDAENPTSIAGHEPATHPADTEFASSTAGNLRALPPKAPLMPLPNAEQPRQPTAAPRVVGAEPVVINTATDDSRAFSWESIAGPTAWDQFKTVLAAIGALAIALKLTRRRDGE
jgi:hypothetical protein